MPTLSGTVKDSVGANVARLVRVYTRDSGGFVGETISNASTGAWSITTSSTREHFAIVHDGTAVDKSQTKLAIRMTGANNSTSFVDSKGNTITPVADAKISTARYRISDSSGLFDGTGDYLQLPAGAMWNLGTSDFFIRFQLYVNAYNANTSRLFQTGNGDIYTSLYITLGLAGGISFAASSNGSSFNLFNQTVAFTTTGAWREIAFGRSGSNFYAWIEGTMTTLPTSASSLYYDAARVPVIGGQAGTNRSLNGNMQFFEFISGSCPYTANYTVTATDDFSSVSNGSENALIYDRLVPA